MTELSEQRLMAALATLSRACAEGAAPPAEDTPTDLSAMDDDGKEVLAEAAMAIAYGAFAARGGPDGPMQSLLAALGLMAEMAGEEPDPPAEILGLQAEEAEVETEIERAGEALDREHGREATPEAQTAALEARILGAALTLAGCTLPEGAEGPGAVRLQAARCLTRLAAGLLAMNAAGGPR